MASCHKSPSGRWRAMVRKQGHTLSRTFRLKIEAETSPSRICTSRTRAIRRSAALSRSIGTSSTSPCLRSQGVEVAAAPYSPAPSKSSEQVWMPDSKFKSATLVAGAACEALPRVPLPFRARPDRLLLQPLT